MEVSTAVSKSVCGEFSGSKGFGNSSDADASDVGVLRSDPAQANRRRDLPGRYRPKAAAAWMAQWKILAAPPWPAAPGCRHRGRCQSPDSRGSCDCRRTPASPTIRPARCPLSAGQSSLIPIQVSRLASACSCGPADRAQSPARCRATAGRIRRCPRADQLSEFIGAEREATVAIGLPDEAQRTRHSMRVAPAAAAGGVASTRGVASIARRGFDMRQVELQHALQIRLVGLGRREQVRRPAPHRLPRRRRTARRRPALRRIGAGCSVTGAGGGAEAIGIAACCALASACRRGRCAMARVGIMRRAVRWRRSARHDGHRENRSANSRRSRACRALRQSRAAAPCRMRRRAIGWQPRRPGGGADRRVQNFGRKLAVADAEHARAGALAHRIRAPSACHSHAGRVLAACAASRGSLALATSIPFHASSLVARAG